MKYLELNYKVNVEFKREDLYGILSTDFKNSCSNLIPFAQTRYILTQSVPVVLHFHDMKFYLYHGIDKYLFETYKTFEGKTTDITFENDSGMKGKATTRYDATVRIESSKEKKAGNVTFSVNIILILVTLGV
jgi:hypothetical protein